MKKLSIIIPVYNEVRTINEVLQKVTATTISGWKKQIIVVDDGSTDGTGQVLTRWEKQCTILRVTKNTGKGNAIRLGLSVASGDIILLQDADLEYSPSDYPTLLDPFENSAVWVVYGSRFLGAHLSTMFVYELGNKFVTLVTNILYNTNITDMETGYKVFRKEVVQGIAIVSRRFDVEPELTAKVLKLGYQIYEVPISYFGRRFEDGKKLTWRDGFVAVWTLLYFRFFH